MFGFKLTSPSIYYYVVHGIIVTIFYFVLSFIYFSGKNTGKGFIQGLVLGFIWLVVSIILDSIITVPLFIKNYAFLISPELLISELWMIIVCVIVGSIKRKQG